MRFATLIAAHDKPKQLQLLLDTLLAGNGDDFVVLHLDAKSELWKNNRGQFSNHASGRVHVVEEPVAVHWGHRSQVDATALMLEIALRQGFTLVHHISGVDWPVAQREEIAAELSALSSPLPAFIDIIGEEQAERMQKYWLRDPIGRTLTGHAQSYYWGRAFKFAQSQFDHIAQRAYGVRSKPYGPWQKGWSWWSLPYDIASRVADELQQNSSRLDRTACPDEHIIPTIVDHLFRDRIQSYRRYIRWSENAWNPEILVEADVPAIQASNAWFARKVDMDKDSSIIQAFPKF